MKECGCRWRFPGLALPALALATFVATGCNRSLGEPGGDPALAPVAMSDGQQERNPSLEETEREYLWQIEHHGNLLTKHGFGPLKRALIRGDAAALASFLGDDFAGAIYRKPREVRLNKELLQVIRRQDAGNPRQPLDAGQFLERLLSYRRLFPQPPKAAINLMRLAPEETDNLDSPYWRGSCLLRLWGETAPGQPAEVALNLEYRIARPSEENLARKGWLHAVTVVQSVEGRARRFLLKDVTRARGIDPGLFHDNWLSDLKNSINGGVFLCDFNRDGILDLLVTDTNGYFLYQGLPGGRFLDVTSKMGLPRTPFRQANHSVAAFVDLDGDGWEDLILGDHIYRNEEGRQFVDYTYRTNLHIPGDAGGVSLADYDRDGLVDLYLTRPGPAKKDSWLSGRSGDSQGNQLWRNKGNWQFENVTEASGASGGSRSTFTAAWLDANNDGWPDLYVINEFGPGVLLVNNRDGTFREQLLAQGPSDFGTMGVTCGDIDNDGNIDLYCANMYSKAGSRVMANLKPGIYPEEIMTRMRQFVAGSQLWRNQGNGQFEKRGQQWQVAGVGWAYGPALADLDNDGWLDLYATAGFMSSSRDEPDG